MRMKSLFFLVLAFLTFSCADGVKEEIVKKPEITAGEKLAKQNHEFLYNFFKQDSLTTEKYWDQANSGLKMLVFIDLEKQKLKTIELNDTFRVVLETKISSGLKPGWTPTGNFSILRKKESRPSKKYGGTMTYWNCLTKDEAIAIHGLKNNSYEPWLGRPLSHGCIRISKKIEQTFYNLVPIGTPVIIK